MMQRFLKSNVRTYILFIQLFVPTVFSAMQRGSNLLTLENDEQRMNRLRHAAVPL